MRNLKEACKDEGTYSQITNETNDNTSENFILNGMRRLNHLVFNHSITADDSTITQVGIQVPEMPLNDSEINILVLGETGVGKSTWINGIANYLKFDNFELALAAKDPICLIPMSFNLVNINPGKQLEKLTIKMDKSTGSKDKNESNAASKGQSSTQEPKVYSYTMNGKKYNLIDTPGICDTRGIEQDIANIKMIFKCLSASKWNNKIHGICLLLKPNEPRLKTSLKYCIEELLVNLHKNAIPNICVIFTNCCGTNYKPGDTMAVLKQLFDEVADANNNHIQLSSANTYCLENECIRMLYAAYNGVTFEQNEIANYSTSWTHTANDTRRLFTYISKLKPHILSETENTYKMRTLLTKCCMKMADYLDQVKNMEKVLTTQKIFKADLKNQGDKNNSSIQIEIIKKQTQKRPSTVCSSQNCIEAMWNPITNENDVFYKSVCCSPCPLKNVPPETFANSNLQQCKIFQSDGNCQNCKCSWRQHMQIYYSQKKVKEGYSNNPKNAKNAKTLKRKTFDSIKATQINISNVRSKYYKVFEESKEHFNFLLSDAIIVHNRAFEVYLNLILEDQKISNNQRKTLQRYKAVSEQFKTLSNPLPSLQVTVIDELDSSDDESIDGTYSVSIPLHSNTPVNHSKLKSIFTISKPMPPSAPPLPQRMQAYIPPVVTPKSKCCKCHFLPKCCKCHFKLHWIGYILGFCAAAVLIILALWGIFWVIYQVYIFVCLYKNEILSVIVVISIILCCCFCGGNED